MSEQKLDKPQLKISPLLLSELSEVCEIEKLVNQGRESFWLRQTFVNELNNANCVYFSASYRSEAKPIQICGFIGCEYIEDVGFIKNFAIHPEFQKKGIGRRLLEYLIEHAKKWNMKHLTLEVRESNKIAIHLYTRLGFNFEGKRPKYYKDEDALILWLNLQAGTQPSVHLPFVEKAGLD